jgi:hypothetical protein
MSRKTLISGKLGPGVPLWLAVYPLKNIVLAGPGPEALPLAACSGTMYFHAVIS